MVWKCLEAVENITVSQLNVANGYSGETVSLMHEAKVQYYPERYENCIIGRDVFNIKLQYKNLTMRNNFIANSC